MSDIEQPVVAHWVSEYLRLTETFIYQYLTHLREFRPIVLTGRINQNMHLFPVSGLFCISDHWRRYSWQWMVSVMRLLTTGELPDERILKQNDAQLIHAHFGPVGFHALRCKRKLGIPLVTSFYGWDMSTLADQSVWQRNYQELFSDGDMFLIEGEYMRTRLIEMGAPAEKVFLQHISIDLNDFEFSPRFLPSKGPIVLLQCGRFIEKKGISYAIKAFALLIDEHPRLQLRIIGDGQLRPQIERLTQELGLEKSVKLLGYLPYKNYSEELRRAHILLCPSVTASDGDSEGGAPTVLLEAQASGLPIVATRHADIPYVTRDGHSAFLVPEHDAIALADRLQYLIKHPEDWEEMGNAGRSWVADRHDITVQAKCLENKYKKLLANITT